MSRITTTVLIFLLLTNGAVTVMSASGLNEDLGVTLSPGISEAMDSAISDLREGFSPSAGIGETLFSLFLAATKVMEIVVSAITATPNMLLNMGFPGWLVFPLFTPLYAISTFELIYMATGRDPV